MPAPPPGAKPVDVGTSVPFRTVEKEVSDVRDRNLDKKKRRVMQVVCTYYVRKLAALVCVLDKDGNDVTESARAHLQLLLTFAGAEKRF